MVIFELIIVANIKILITFSNRLNHKICFLTVFASDFCLEHRISNYKKKYGEVALYDTNIIFESVRITAFIFNIYHSAQIMGISQ